MHVLLCQSVRAALTKYHSLDDLTTGIYFSELWKLEVGDKGVSRVGFSGSLFLAYTGSSSPCVLTWSSMCVHMTDAFLTVSKFSLLYKAMLD